MASLSGRDSLYAAAEQSWRTISVTSVPIKQTRQPRQSFMLKYPHGVLLSNWHASRGRKRNLSNGLPKAVEHLRASVKLNPGDALTHTNLGRVYALQGNVDEAKTELELAIRLDPGPSLAEEALNA